MGERGSEGVRKENEEEEEEEGGNEGGRPHTLTPDR